MSLGKSVSIPVSLTAIAIVLCLPPDRPAITQDGAEESLEEIIVVGTRRTGRTEANTPVPVDVLNRADLCHAVGDTDFECI